MPQPAVPGMTLAAAMFHVGCRRVVVRSAFSYSYCVLDDPELPCLNCGIRTLAYDVYYVVVWLFTRVEVEGAE